ncbi:MAG: S-methyl-5-thioribose-1-phosphate isomerase [Actinomycetota bacterium]|nr:S-methyl-5-thioribose-1-phosphate isomerase [Actinomycetota bacterium]
MTLLDPSGIRNSVNWAGNHIEVIDQTLLPGELRVRDLRSADEVVDAIRRLVVRGAPAIGACGALGMVVGLDEARPGDVGEARRALADLEERIGAARPTAVNLSWALRRVRRAAEQGSGPAGMRKLALAEAQAIIDEDREACRLIGEHGRKELAAASKVLTHCNTGRLATAGWGTALGVIYAKAAHGEPIEVYASETRPLLQGARLTAWELEDAGIPVTLVPDGAAASALAGGMVQAAIVGADRIAANGDTANKIGTYGQAVAAKEARIPFYVAAPLSSFDRSMASGKEIVIELRDAAEVRGWQGVPSAPQQVAVWNPAFDVTPHHLITAFITEKGVLRPPFSESITAAFDRAEAEGLRS